LPIAAIVPVPEASMHEDDLPVAREDKIGAARQVAPVQPKAISKAVHGAPHSDFRPRIRLPDARHALGQA
jgi:hypothetical protein